MKNLIAILTVFALIAGTNSFAQTKQKYGHINSQELLDMMPERTQAEKELQAYAKQLETQLQSMMTEFETKLADFQNNEMVMGDVIKQSKTEELESLNQRIQKFQQDAQNDIMKKENQLVQPILEKAKKAIEDVAEENGYTYVFDTSSGALLYQPESDDIMELVKKKMGLTDQPATTTPAAGGGQ